MRKENIKGHFPALRKYAKNTLKFEVKLKKFSLPTYETHASSASRHHAAGARRRLRPRIPRVGQIPTAKKTRRAHDSHSGPRAPPSISAAIGSIRVCPHRPLRK